MTGCVRARSCVLEMRVRRFYAAWGVTVYSIVLPFARVCRGLWFGFVGSTLLRAVGTCVVLSFEVMPGLCCFLRVTQGVHVHGRLRARLQQHKST